MPLFRSRRKEKAENLLRQLTRLTTFDIDPTPNLDCGWCSIGVKCTGCREDELLDLFLQSRCPEGVWPFRRHLIEIRNYSHRVNSGYRVHQCVLCWHQRVEILNLTLNTDIENGLEGEV